MRKLLLATSLLALVAQGAAAQQAAPPPAALDMAPPTEARITPPAAIVGGEVGSDYFLANYTDTVAWLQMVDQESDRMMLVSLGKTAEGREHYMAVISAPENLHNVDHYRDIARQLALAEGLTDDQARALAKEGKAMVWMDAGLHATEVVNAQAHIQIIHEMVTQNDPETLRLLNDDIMLFVFANPDGLELVADWYMGPQDPKKRNTNTIPVLYQKYIGHDNNRDSFASTQPETTNLNRADFITWFPQIVYNQHQTGPAGTVVFVPPFRDPFNYNVDPLVITQGDVLGYQMHSRLIAEGKPGSAMRGTTLYSTWFNGNIRTIGYFHNVIGILTEIIGNPTPQKIPLVPEHQLPREDLPAPIAPQPWHFQQSLDYVKTMDRAILDWASRYRETILYNRYKMGRNQIEAGSNDSWVISPKRIDAVEAAAEPIESSRGADIYDSALYDTVLHDPSMRAPRGYIIDPEAQHDLPATIAFLNSLIKTGIEVEQATEPFTVAGKQYPTGSYVIRTAHAYRPHILDMFEPQDYPHDFEYEGGPPIRPYDVAGYTLAFQMGVAFDRILDGFTAPVQPTSGLLSPPPGRIIGSGSAGYVVSHASNNSFTLTNRLLKAGAQLYWLEAPITIGGENFGSGALWIPAGAAAQQVIEASLGELGIDAYAVASAPTGERMEVEPQRIGLVDVYGGSMPSGWTRWLFEKFEFPYTLVFPQELDAGNLEDKYDVLVFQSDVVPDPDAGNGYRRQPSVEDTPEQYRAMLGAITPDKTYPQIETFANQGGTVITIGDSTRLAKALGVPVSDPLTEPGPNGELQPLPAEKYFIPGSVLASKVDNSVPLGYGITEATDVFFNRSPVFKLADGAAGVRAVSWFDSAEPLRSGWAWGQNYLEDTVAVVDADVGRGKVFLLGPEVTNRAQPWPTFKYLFNGIFYGPAASRTAALEGAASRRVDD